MSSKDVVKGTISGLFGILVAMIGPAPIDTYPRFTFGVPALESGINSTVVLIGIFAIAEIFVMSENAKKEKVEETVTQNYKIKRTGIWFHRILERKTECASIISDWNFDRDSSGYRWSTGKYH